MIAKYSTVLKIQFQRKYSKTGFLLIGMFLFFHPVFSQTDSVAIRFAKSISAEDLRKHLEVLASDQYEGRETGQKGQKMAADYIKKHFMNCGIPPRENLKDGYYQQFPLQVFQPQELQIEINGKSFIPRKDFFSFSSILYDTTLIINDLMFAGYGINSENYNDYKSLNEKDLRNLLILGSEPIDKTGNSILTGTTKSSEWSNGIRKKYSEAQSKGVSILFIVEDDIASAYKKSEHKITSTKMKIAEKSGKSLFSTPFTIFISKEMANSILGSEKYLPKVKKEIAASRQPQKKNCKSQIKLKIKQATSVLSAENVIGYIEGSDLKNELVVLTAHYDHLGKQDGIVFNGADDDGSGTVAVLELAEAFALAKKNGNGPRRSVLIMPVSGEEKGLLGSEYYTSNPVFPLDKTVANLNIDMVGRIDDAHKGDGNYIYLIGSDKLSLDLHEISESANLKYSNLKLDYTYNAESDPNRFYYRSDHYNFAKNNIPVIFYFNGVHEDYHRETDDVEKIDFNKMEKITRLVFHTAWELANREERIKLKK